MLQDSLKYFHRAPHLMIYPGLALMMVVFGFNTFGDGLRFLWIRACAGDSNFILLMQAANLLHRKDVNRQ